MTDLSVSIIIIIVSALSVFIATVVVSNAAGESYKLNRRERTA